MTQETQIRVTNRLRQRIMLKAWKMHRQAMNAYTRGIYKRKPTFASALKAAWDALKKAVREYRFNRAIYGQPRAAYMAANPRPVQASSFGRTR